MPRRATPPPSAPSTSVLRAVGPWLSREVDLDALLDQMVARVAAALDADRGTIYLIDRATGELVSRAAHLPEIREIRLAPGQGVAGAAVSTGATINLPSADADHRFFAEIDRRTGYRTRSLLATPLVDREARVMGAVQVLNARSGKFGPEHEASLKRLAAEVALAIEHTSLYPALRTSPEASGTTDKRPHRRYNRIVGTSAAMQAVFELVRKAAATDATVLLRGESGTGKELVARAIHVNGPRRDGPFVKVDCTTIPATLMEDELFGHERGAFTGADARAIGKCELADKGTLFLDEIGELPLPLQAKLLRFIQDREFERVGGRRTLTSDARVVAATHRDLEVMVGRGAFREDLYYRIRVVPIRLPALRERGTADVLALAEHFLEQLARKHGRPALTLSDRAREALCRHTWPGNIRELENCLEAAVVVSERGPIEPEHLTLPQALFAPADDGNPWRPAPLAEVERAHILRTLASVDGNRTRAAALLGIGRNTLNRKLKDYGVS